MLLLHIDLGDVRTPRRGQRSALELEEMRIELDSRVQSEQVVITEVN